MSSKEPHAPPIRQFVQDYRRLRLAEGFASTDPVFARGLPFRDSTGRNVAAWRRRAFHFVLIRAGLAVLPGVGRVLDVGAGNGWLARRLAAAGYRVTALDVDVTSSGLGGLDDARVQRVRGDLEALPFSDGHFDVVIAGAALHYATDLELALGEAARVLRAGGLLIVADSPLYRDALDRHRAWCRTVAYYTAAGAPHLARRYRGLTRAELDGPRLFRFITVSPGLGFPRGVLARLSGREVGPRLPLLLGLKR